MKELNARNEQDQDNLGELQDEVELLQSKLKMYKKQAEQAEDEMNRYASKYKMMQHQVSEAEERAEYAENRLEKMRAQRSKNL